MKFLIPENMNRLFPLPIETGTVTEQAMNNIAMLLSEVRIGVPLEYLTDVGMEYKTENGVYVKRLESLLFKKGCLKGSAKESWEKVKAEVGTLARKNTIDEGDLAFDLTTDINWTPGDFGDAGSCYWGGKNLAIDTIKNNKGGALRVFQKAGARKREHAKGENEWWYQPLTSQKQLYPGYVGIGRCWIHENDDMENNPCLILFNFYSNHKVWTIHTMAPLLASALNAKSIPVSVSSRSAASAMYFNGGSGLLIDIYDSIIPKIPKDDKGPHSVNLEWVPGTKDQKETSGCLVCGKASGLTDATIYRPGGSAKVRSCTSHLNSCDKCGQQFFESQFPEDVKVRHRTGTLGKLPDMFCPGCLAAMYLMCKVCGNVASKVDTMRTGTGHCCKWCALEKFTAGEYMFCSRCGATTMGNKDKTCRVCGYDYLFTHANRKTSKGDYLRQIEDRLLFLARNQAGTNTNLEIT